MPHCRANSPSAPIASGVLPPAGVKKQNISRSQTARYAHAAQHCQALLSALRAPLAHHASSIAPSAARTLPAVRIRAQLSHSQWPAFAGARQQAASAAGCLLCSKSGSTSNSIQLSITRRCTPPCGLHLRSNAFVFAFTSPHSHAAAFGAWRCLSAHLASTRLVWRMHNQLSDKPALSRCLGRQKISSIAPVLMKIAKEPDDGYTSGSLRQEQPA